MKKLIFIISILSVCLLPVMGWADTSVTQHGITWTFDKDYEVGQFVNGDYWVVGPVSIIEINPPSHVTVEGEQDEEGRIFSTGTVINGSMINPAEYADQGWIDYAEDVSFLPEYSQELNVAFGVSDQNPLVISGNKSLVSTTSRVYTRPPLPATRLKRAAILTVVNAVPAPNSFRPSFAGNNKTMYSTDSLDYSLLAKLPQVQSTPNLSDIEEYFEKPWLDYVGSATGRGLHPSDNMPNYGASMSRRIGTAALMLNLDFTDREKEKLLISFVQYGIDIWGVYKTGRTSIWSMDGGHGPGRKLPILFAGYVLGDPEMSAIGSHDLDDPVFGEDQVTWYLNRPGVEQWHRPLITDNPADPDINNPEWPVKVLYQGEMVNAKYQYASGGNNMNLHRDYEDAYYLDPEDYLSNSIDSDSIELWKSDGSYIRDDIRKVDGVPVRVFVAQKKHIGTSINKPGSGAEWNDYWLECERDEADISYMGLPEYIKAGPYSRFQGRWISRRADASYRTNHGFPLHEIVLTAHIMGLKQFWNHDALFDYTDRYVEWLDGLPSNFSKNMWDTYRSDYGDVWVSGAIRPQPEPEPEPDPDTDTGPETETEIDIDAANNIPDKTQLRISNNIIKSNSAANIDCDVKEAGKLTVKIYDSKGREIIILWNKHEEPGMVSITWMGEDSGGSKVGSGIYIVGMKIGIYSETKKIAVVK